MIITPSMGLKRWDQPNDVFSYVDLSNNWGLVDQHDHSAGKGVQIPTAGIANLAIDSTKLATDSVIAGKIAAASVAGDRLVNSTVPDTKLSSPNNAVYKNLFQAGVTLVAGAVAGTYLANAHSGTPVVPALVRWNPSDFTVGGKATQWRISMVLATNSTAPGSSVTPAILPVTGSTGGAGALTFTTGAAFQTFALGTPGASSITTNVSPDIAAPVAAGSYALGITTGATIAANSVLSITIRLQYRHV